MIGQAAWYVSKKTIWLQHYFNNFSHKRSEQLLKQNAIFSFSVILQMTGFVRAALEQEVKGQVVNLENQVVKQVTTELRPTVIQ